MKTAMHWLMGAMAAACLMLPTSPACQAQQAPAQPKAAARKAPAKPRGRLPAYYNQVVTPQQREKIYAAQSSYAERIEALEAQLKELRAQLDAEIKAVLSPEQLKKVEELTEAAKARTRKPAVAATEPAAATPVNASAPKK